MPNLYVRALLNHQRGRDNQIMNHDSPLVRQWILLKTLASRRYGATVQEMAQELNVHEKTIRRDLEAFQTAGFPLEETVGERGRKNWRLAPGGNLPELNFAFDEALALYLSRRLMEPLAGTLLWDAAQSAFKKIRACLGKPALDYLEKMAGNLHHRVVGSSDYSAKGDLIDQLLQAIEDRRQTYIAYQSLQATEPAGTTVYPLGMAFYRGSLYLVAHAPEHEQVRHYKVDRISEVEITGLPFNRPDDFDLQQHLAGSFGVYHGNDAITIRVRFAPPVVRYVEEQRWHDSQQLQRQRDGSLLAEFQLSNLTEIKSWLLSFGRHAQVLEPAALIEELRAEHLAAARVYEPGDREQVTGDR